MTVSPNFFNDDDHIFRSDKFKSVVEDAMQFFANTPVHPLLPTSRFIGSGVYGLYYIGDFPDYQPLVLQNNSAIRYPIYIGKAVPRGWRTGRISKMEQADLHGRLREHARSISEANNLNLGDFRCRFMILKGVESDLIVPTEAALIRKYSPLWNQTVAGFGLHHVGKERFNQQRTQWDTLHPGRSWTRHLTGISPDLDGIRAAIAQALSGLPAP